MVAITNHPRERAKLNRLYNTGKNGDGENVLSGDQPCDLFRLVMPAFFRCTRVWLSLSLDFIYHLPQGNHNRSFTRSLPTHASQQTQLYRFLQLFIFLVLYACSTALALILMMNFQQTLLLNIL
jgi:hypothetical protein